MNKGQFKTGKSGNPKGRAKSNILSAEVVNLTVPDMPIENTEIDYELKDWYLFGTDNLFPQALAALNRRSPTHRGIINFKTIYIAGDKFFTEDKKLEKYLKLVNNENESLKKVYKKLVLDKQGQGNAYLELVKDTKGSFLNLFHKDATKCRVKREGKAILLHPKWSDVEGNMDKLVEIPLYPEFKRIKGSKNLHSIFHFKEYEPEFQHYGLAGWIAGMDAAAIGYKTNKWNISRLNNEFQTSGILVVSGNMGKKDAETLKDKIKEAFTDEGNQGKLFIIIKEMGGEETKYTPINENREAHWLKLHKQSEQDLLVAHNWFPSLSGFHAAGQLGNVEQIRNEYQIALNTVITDEQDFFLETFKLIFEKELKLNCEDLAIINKPPFNLLDTLDMNLITRIWEARKMAGYEYDEKDKEQQKYITTERNATNNSQNINK